MADAALHVGVARATLGGFAAGQGARGRTLLAVAAIALGVALGFGVQLVNHTAVAEFASGLATLTGDADLTVQGGRAGFDEGLYARLARDDAVAAASPVVQLEATVAGREQTLTLIGIDALRAVAVTPALIGESTDRFDVLRPDVVFLSPAAAAWLDVAPGQTIALQRGVDLVHLRVAGLVHAERAARLAVMDIAGAQDRFDRVGTLSRIDLRLRPGTNAQAAAARLASVLPAGVGIVTPQSSIESTTLLSRAYRVNLDVLALVALFTGGLLVFSTQALAVLRRRLPFALLRSLGLARGSLVRLVVLEGALLGAVGAVLGLGGGFVLATIAIRWFGVDLGAGFFRGAAPALDMDWWAAAGFGLAGIAAAVIGSYAPAREAARAAPAAALKAGDIDLDWGRGRHAWPAVLALLLGVACTALPPVWDLPIFGYAAIALLLLGTLRLLARVSGFVLAVVPPPRAPAGALALAQIRHAPAQSTLSLAAIVAGVSLMAAMAIMVASFRGSLDAWLMQVLPADAYLRAAGGSDTAYLPETLQRSVQRIDGVARAEFLRTTSLAIAPGAPRVTLLARDIDRARPQDRLPLVGASIAPSAQSPPPAWISEATADRFGWRVGGVVQLPLADRPVPFTVAGTWRDYARQQGAIVVERAAYVAATGDARSNDVALWLAPGASLRDVRARVESLAGAERIEVSTPGELRAISLRIFDRTFAVTYALEAVAVLIGLTGLSSAFGALVLARRREFGVLRHIGMTRAQVGAMLATEGLALGTIGVLVGLMLGFVIALILIHVVNRQSFHWSMDLAVPWVGLAALAGALIVLSTLTAWLSGRSAMTANVVTAVKDDW